jgi:hypothetical protein
MVRSYSTCSLTHSNAVVSFPCTKHEQRAPWYGFPLWSTGDKQGKQNEADTSTREDPKKKAQGFSRQANIEGFQKQNERELELKASSGNKTLIIQENTHTHTHTQRDTDTDRRFRNKDVVHAMQNAKLKTRQTKQNKTEKQNKKGRKWKQKYLRKMDWWSARMEMQISTRASIACGGKQTQNQGTTHLTDKHWQIPNCQMPKKKFSIDLCGH